VTYVTVLWKSVNCLNIYCVGDIGTQAVIILRAWNGADKWTDSLLQVTLQNKDSKVVLCGMEIYLLEYSVDVFVKLHPSDAGTQKTEFQQQDSSKLTSDAFRKYVLL